MTDRLHGRILITAPTGRDAELICAQLRSAGIVAEKMDSAVTLAKEVLCGAGAIVITDEALTPEGTTALSIALAKQPAWSEVPIILLTHQAAMAAKIRGIEELAHQTSLTFVDRPVRIKALVSAVQAALRARRRQYEIRDLMTQLENRLHERDKFLAILGHELRNPLSAILLGSQMTNDNGSLDPEHAQLIERQARHLSQLVNDLLDLSRVVTGKIILKPRVIDLRDLAEQSVHMVEVARQAQNVSISAHFPDERIPVHGDPVRIDQILSNLLTNAIKYTPAGGHIDVWIEQNERTATIRVGDDGVGIAPDRIEGIFEMFAQLDDSIGRAQGGMGIGLSLVRNLVHLHGGTVKAVSAGVGKGSEFIVTLPLASDDAREPEAIEAPAAAANEPPIARRIVIVEDNKDVRDLLALKLRRLGHDVIGAGDGVAGLKAISENRPDLALVDLGLPFMDGYELASRTRQELGDNVILVAVSGFGQPDDKRRAAEAGFDEHITKPADVRDIESLLQRYRPRT